jgi:hypothetical protein
MIRLTADPVTSNSTQGSEGSGVLEAMKLVREGRFIRLDHLWEPGRNGVLGNIAIETIRGTVVRNNSVCHHAAFFSGQYS